jgi:hypothetical protein
MHIQPRLLRTSQRRPWRCAAPQPHHSRRHSLPSTEHRHKRLPSPQPQDQSDSPLQRKHTPHSTADSTDPSAIIFEIFCSLFQQCCIHFFLQTLLQTSAMAAFLCILPEPYRACTPTSQLHSHRLHRSNLRNSSHPPRRFNLGSAHPSLLPRPNGAVISVDCAASSAGHHSFNLALTPHAQPTSPTQMLLQFSSGTTLPSPLHSYIAPTHKYLYQNLTLHTTFRQPFAPYKTFRQPFTT